MKDAIGTTIVVGNFLFVSRPKNGFDNTSIHKVVRVGDNYVATQRVELNKMTWNFKNKEYFRGIDRNTIPSRIIKTRRSLIFDPPEFIKEIFNGTL